jgi:hypothetical protein
MQCTVHFIITLFNVGNVLLCVIYQLNVTVFDQPRVLVVRAPDTDHEVSGSIPGSAMGIFLEGEDSHGDSGLGSLVELTFKALPGTSYITVHLIGTT